MTVFVLYVFFVIVIGMIAGSYNRSSVGWMMLALLLSPLIAGLAIVVVGKSTDDSVEQTTSDTGGDKVCFECAETIKAAAKICRFCKSKQIE